MADIDREGKEVIKGKKAHGVIRSRGEKQTNVCGIDAMSIFVSHTSH